VAFRDAVYETLFDLAQSHSSRLPVVIAGPFTSEGGDAEWPHRLAARFGVMPEFHYVWCHPDERKRRVSLRGATRDLPKLADWDAYVSTCRETAPEAHARFGSTAEVLDASGAHTDRVDPAVVLAIFAERGLRRVLSEGGPSLISLLTEDDLLDELCVTIAPILVGGAARRIASGSGEAHTRMRRSHLLTDDEGYLYTRYVRDGLGGE
jgi:hypothetical protein